MTALWYTGIKHIEKINLIDLDVQLICFEKGVERNKKVWKEESGNAAILIIFLIMDGDGSVSLT